MGEKKGMEGRITLNAKRPTLKDRGFPAETTEMLRQAQHDNRGKDGGWSAYEVRGYNAETPGGRRRCKNTVFAKRSQFSGVL